LFRNIIARCFLLAILCGVFGLAANSALGQTKLLRFPDIYGDRVVFTYGGDLWTAPASGGSAIRLTSHPGVEVFGKFSPDGKWIAFTGQYDGDEQVYVVSSSGGVPRQVTFYPAKGPFTPRWGWDNLVYGWSNDGKKIFGPDWWRGDAIVAGQSRGKIWRTARMGKPCRLSSSGTLPKADRKQSKN